MDELEKRKKRNKATAQWRLRQKQKGICIKCGKAPASGEHTRCEGCLEKKRVKAREKTKANKALGLCIKCSENSDGNRLCGDCFIKERAIRHFSDISKWIELKEMFEAQNKKCPYTGRELVMGTDIALDHKIPRKLGGSNEMENLHWVSFKANEMKWHYREDEFLSLVEEIYLHVFNA